MMKMCVVWLSFKMGVFVLQNRLPLWGRRYSIRSYDIASEVNIAFYQLYLTLGIP